MNRIKFAFITGILPIVAFVFSCGDESGGGPANDADKCNGEIFNSSYSFCYAEQIFQKCNGKIYNPLESFCSNNVVYEKCGGDIFDNSAKFCNNNRIYAKCAGREYNPLEFGCDTTATPDVLYAYPKCPVGMGVVYDSLSSFCYNNVVYQKCNGNKYDPSVYFCYYYEDGREVLERKCARESDTIPFPDPENNFCFQGTIYAKCGDKENKYNYNPLNSFCYAGKLFPKCGNNEYNAAILFCKNDTIYEKCGDQEYDPLNYFCRGNVPVEYKKCDNGMTIKKYDDSKQFCAGGKLHDLCDTKPYETTINFCAANMLYPKCYVNNKNEDGTYKPYEAGCFEGKLYPICEAEGVHGNCVQNKVLRCKQVGLGDKYIVRPYPGMQCDTTGKIVGKITVGSETIKTVQIGTQVWMAENLAGANKNYLFYWKDACKDCPSNQNASYSQRKGLCPVGWRLPNSAEWQELISYAGGASIAGNRLKSSTGWKENGNGLDNYGFNAKPLWFKGDIASPLSNLNADGAFWWTSTELPNEKSMAKFWYVISSDTEAEELAYEKEYFQFSVRCLQNIE